MIWEKPRDIEFESKDIPQGKDLCDPPTPIQRAIDSLVPRGGTAPENVYVSLNEYIVRLAHLNRKVEGVEYRNKQWVSCVVIAKERFGQLADAHDPKFPNLPAGAVGTLYFTFEDSRVSYEFEALLFAIRSALDILARVVAAHYKGYSSTKSYRSLHRLLSQSEPNSRVATLIDSAMSGWVEDLTARRDAAGHYVALSAHSEISSTTDAKGDTETERFFLAIPRTATRASPSVWWDQVPVVGGGRRAGKSLELPGKEKVEAAAIYDGEDNLIVRCDGPLPSRPEIMEAESYVQDVVVSFLSHVEDVLGCLRSEKQTRISTP